MPAAPAQRGDIQQTLSYSGNVQAKDQITVLPKATGRVEQVLVDIGSPVHAGDVIAELEQDLARDPGAASPGQSVRGAGQAGDDPGGTAPGRRCRRAGGLRPTASQAGGYAGPGSTRGRGGRRSPRWQPRMPSSNLMLSGGRPEAVTQAQAAVDAAQQKLALLQKGATDDVRQAAASAVSADVAQVTATEAAYAALGGTSAADLQQLQAQVDALNSQIAAAQTALNSTNAAIDSQKTSSAADIQAAQTAFDQAQAQVNAAQAALNQANNPTQASLAQAQAALSSAQAQQAAAESNQTALEQKASGLCAPQVSPINGHTYLQPNGTACNEPKQPPMPRSTRANAAVEAAQGQLDQLRRGGAPAQLAAAQAQVASAQALVKATKARLDAVANGGVQAQRAQLQAAHDQAQISVDLGSGQPERRAGPPAGGAERHARRAAQGGSGAGRRGARKAQGRPGQAGTDQCRPAG